MRYLLPLLILCAITAHAQESRFTAVTGPVKQYFPAEWRISLMQEDAWVNYVEAHRLYYTTTAFSDLGNHVTYVRANYALKADPKDVQHTLLHEAGHAVCNCVNEVRAERFAIEHTLQMHPTY